MAHIKNSTIVEKAIEITIAQVSSSDKPAYKESGDSVAEYLETVYNKLVELYGKSDD